ncbi:M23 family metallopeptidase [Schleiferia thermophila]|jgi:hypothetical protein|uniref:M23 family metallopeptidase n=2 Tax=Schleiferia thermophila TaxID=884107 RepID=UPI0004E6C3ED|nr:M23 family metallopeptidase [Schleiferia thermophila]KFD39557.1 hypothetical protein AT05_04045 [Schleiferia thermophila str. Yellowstone]
MRFAVKKTDFSRMIRWDTGLVALLAVFGLVGSLSGQPEIKLPEYFGPPLELPLQLSGNFGELRTNHFHAGLDLRTGGVEGKKVFAAADGYVARILVSAYGYGKALYIQHPNGYMTVYAHLQRFNTAIEQYVRQEQYKRESFEVDLYPEPGMLRVKKGEVIALSGNTGGSAGPHLHFEIRDQGSERAINPMAFGFEVPDSKPPEFLQCMVYELDEDFLEIQRRILPVRRVSPSVYRLEKDTVSIPVLAGLGVETVDYKDGSGFKFGVYTLSLYVDGELIYKFSADAVRFDETRYLNAHIDYDYRVNSGRNVHQLFVLPGNRLDVYTTVVNRGLISLTPDSVVRVQIVASDISGNVSELAFWARGVSETTIAQPQQRRGYFGFNDEIVIKDDHFVFLAESGTFYRPVRVNFSVKPLEPESLSAQVHFRDESVPFHKFATLRMKVNGSYPNASKFVLVNTVGNKRNVVTGTLEGDWYTAKIRSFGKYWVEADLKAPTIVPQNIPAGGNMRHQALVRFRISDDLSGIKSYRMEINGQWVLAEFDGKTGLLYHIFETPPAGRKMEIKVKVTDGVGNIGEYRTEIIR